jgi:hypothetical protein
MGHFTRISQKLRQFFFLSTLIVFYSCSGKDTKSEAIFMAMTENLEKSNEEKNYGSEESLTSLNQKIIDFRTQDEANYWQPVARAVQNITDSMCFIIDNLKKIEEINKESITKLYNQLKNYKERILNVEPTVKDDFAMKFIFVTKQFDSQHADENDFRRIFFTDISKTGQIAFLTNVQNNLRRNEGILLRNFDSRCGNRDLTFDFYSVVASQNSRILKGGDELQIKAGIGAFSRAVQASIFINNKKVPLEEGAFAMYKLTVEKKPGNYQVPFRIEFFDQEKGEEKVVESFINYTVAKECSGN